MKRFSKTLCLILSFAMLLGACFSLAACEDIKKIEITVSVYDISNNKQTEKTITLELYRHLAPDTVDAIKEYVNKGFYDGLPFYKFASSYSNQIMFGDYELSDGAVTIHDADYVKKIDGEFEKAGVVGSDLVNEDGSVGLWHTWYERDGYTGNNDAAKNSGKATIYMPTQNISGYNGYFCVFGKIAADDETAEAISLIKSVLSNYEYYTEYTVYYTGEYGENGETLEFHCDLTGDYEEKTEDEDFSDSVFKAEGEQFVCFNSQKIYVPVATVNGKENVVTAKIVSAKVK